MKVKELFEVIDAKTFYPDITIIDYDLESVKTFKSISTFKYLQDGKTYIDKMLSQFGDRTIVPHGVVSGTDENEIDYIIIDVK